MNMRNKSWSPHLRLGAELGSRKAMEYYILKAVLSEICQSVILFWKAICNHSSLLLVRAGLYGSCQKYRGTERCGTIVDTFPAYAYAGFHICLVRGSYDSRQESQSTRVNHTAEVEHINFQAALLVQERGWQRWQL